MQGTDLVTKTSSVVTSQPNIPMLSYRQRLRFITKTDEKYLDLYVRPMRVLLTFPAVTYTAIQYGFCLCWISAIASITAIILPYPPYNFGTTAMGLTNLAPFIGSLLGTGLNGILGDWLIGWLARRNQGFYEPETRLYLLPLPVLTISGGLVMTGITAYNVCQSQIRKVQPLIILPNSWCIGPCFLSGPGFSGSGSELYLTPVWPWQWTVTQTYVIFFCTPLWNSSPDRWTWLMLRWADSLNF